MSIFGSTYGWTEVFYFVQFDATADIQSIYSFWCDTMWIWQRFNIINFNPKRGGFASENIGTARIHKEDIYMLRWARKNYLIINLNSDPGVNITLSLRISSIHSEFSIELNTISLSLSRGLM